MPEPARDEVRDKRLAILDAARELFADQGYDETTIAEVARKAGVAVGTVYLYFANKHEIQLDVCLALNLEIASVIQSPAVLSLPLRQVPRAMIEAVFQTSRKNMRFMWAYNVDPQTQMEVERLLISKHAVATALDMYFQSLIAAGVMGDFPTLAYAEFLENLVSRILQVCFGFERGEREEFHREGLINFIDRLFFGPPLAGGYSGA